MSLKRFLIFAPFGEGSGPIHMDEVGCSGSESRLVDCSYISNHNCRHSEDAGVRCRPCEFPAMISVYALLTYRVSSHRIEHLWMSEQYC